MATANTSLKRNILLAGAVLTFISVYHQVLLCKKIFTHDSIIWYGSYYYYVDSMLSGHFPYWDPYMQTGTYFYPNISLLGLLDPTVLLSALFVKVFNVSILTAYIYFYLGRLVIFGIGVYYLFEHITKCKASAVLSAGVLVLSLTPGYFRQPGAVDLIFLTPLALYFLLLILEDPSGPRRYVNIGAFALITGVIMNVFIPAYHLFTLVFFVCVLLVLGIVQYRRVSASLNDRKLLAFLGVSVLLTLMIAAPPLMVMLKDAGGKGELFPMVRIVQKSGGNLKRIMATDVVDAAVSNKYTGQQGVFSSYGNMVNMVYPDIFESIPHFADDLFSEIPQYIGIIPLMFAILGALYYKSRYKYLALIMMMITAVNMFSFAGMSGKPFNFLQKGFNEIFPLLKMLEVREVFGSFFLMFLGMLLCMGLRIFFDEEKFADLVTRRYLHIAALCLAIITFKAAITGYYTGRVVVASLHDLFVFGQLVFFVAAVWLVAKGMVNTKLLYAVMILVVFLDMHVYGAYNAKYILAESGNSYELANAGRANRGRNEFDYFREPWIPTPGAAFGESILKMKDVLSPGNNHSIFTTKRYYDILTHVPFENQMVLSGVVYPVVRFFPMEKVLRADDRKREFDYFVEAEDRLLAESIVIEKEGLNASGKTSDLGDLAQYEDVAWLQPASLLYSVAGYVRRQGAMINEIRRNQGGLLHTEEYSLDVKQFSPNDIVMQANTSTDGYLLYNDGWSKYWEAYDNGRRVPVKIANYNSKAVYLPKGEHTVRFVFNPVHYKVGLVLYYTGLLSVVGVIIFFYIRCRRPDARFEGPRPG